MLYVISSVCAVFSVWFAAIAYCEWRCQKAVRNDSYWWVTPEELRNRR